MKRREHHELKNRVPTGSFVYSAYPFIGCIIVQPCDLVRVKQHHVGCFVVKALYKTGSSIMHQTNHISMHMQLITPCSSGFELLLILSDEFWIVIILIQRF